MKIKNSTILALIVWFVVFVVLPIFIINLDLPELSLKAIYERYFLSDEEYCSKPQNQGVFSHCPKDRCKIINDYDCSNNEQIENLEMPFFNCMEPEYDRCVPK